IEVYDRKGGLEIQDEIDSLQTIRALAHNLQVRPRSAEGGDSLANDRVMVAQDECYWFRFVQRCLGSGSRGTDTTLVSVKLFRMPGKPPGECTCFQSAVKLILWPGFCLDIRWPLSRRNGS